MMIKFYAKPKKIGNSYFVRIPMDYINNNLVDPNKEQQFNVQE